MSILLTLKNTSLKIESSQHSCFVYVWKLTNSLTTADVQSVILLSVLILLERMTSDVEARALFSLQNCSEPFKIQLIKLLHFAIQA